MTASSRFGASSVIDDGGNSPAFVGDIQITLDVGAILAFGEAPANALFLPRPAASPLRVAAWPPSCHVAGASSTNDDEIRRETQEKPMFYDTSTSLQSPR